MPNPSRAHKADKLARFMQRRWRAMHQDEYCTVREASNARLAEERREAELIWLRLFVQRELGGIVIL